MITEQNSVTLRTMRDKEGAQTISKLKPTWKQLTVRLPEEVHRALKIHAAEVNSGMAEIIERLVREYLVKGGKS
jgi:predicted HicB family RNase H-like nuclease